MSVTKLLKGQPAKVWLSEKTFPYRKVLCGDGEEIILGEGSFGQVKVMYSKKRKVYVAVKTFKGKASELTETFLQEVNALRILAIYPSCSTNVGCFVDAGYIRTTKKFVIISELVPGIPGDLWAQYNARANARIADERLTVSALEGLAHLHKLNLAHRDIKPDNIIVTTDAMRTEVLSSADAVCVFYGQIEQLRKFGMRQSGVELVLSKYGFPDKVYAVLIDVGVSCGLGARSICRAVPHGTNGYYGYAYYLLIRQVLAGLYIPDQANTVVNLVELYKYGDMFALGQTLAEMLTGHQAAMTAYQIKSGVKFFDTTVETTRRLYMSNRDAVEESMREHNIDAHVQKAIMPLLTEDIRHERVEALVKKIQGGSDLERILSDLRVAGLERFAEEIPLVVPELGE